VYERYNLLIIDSSSESRGKLKQAALALPVFHKVLVCSSFEEAREARPGGKSPDLVFVSYRFDEAEITEFIAASREAENGKDCAYCAVLKAGDQNNSTIAEGMLGGIDGFIFEPYSADNLREIAEVTAKVKLRAAESRKKAAMLVLLKELQGHIDAVAFYRKKGKDPVNAVKRMQKSAAALKKFDGAMFEIYIETITDFFGELPPPMSLSYDGVSKRVRERLEKKMLDELEALYQV